MSHIAILPRGRLFLLCFVLAALGGNGHAASWNGVVIPQLGLLHAPDAEVSRHTEQVGTVWPSGDPYYRETTLNDDLALISVRTGAAVRDGSLTHLMTGGIGRMMSPMLGSSEGWASPVLLADYAIHYSIPATRSWRHPISIGPRVGVLYVFDPVCDCDWVRIEPGAGWTIGADVVIEVIRKVPLILSLDYVRLDLDLTGRASWPLEDDNYDLSGYMIRAGALFSF